jgi:two-component system, NarL family, sensor histidine kinase UhpB
MNYKSALTILDLMYPPMHLRATAQRVPGALWHRLPVRSRILISFLLLNLFACTFAGFLAVMDARSRVKAEVRSPLDLAGRYIKETAQHFDRATQPPGALLATLAVQLKQLRHLRVAVLDAGGNAVPAPAEAALTEMPQDGPPAWFAALAGSEPEYRQIYLLADGKKIGSVILRGDATDELNEVWNGYLKTGFVWLVANTSLMVLFYFVLGKLLKPLHTLSSGMLNLENGHYRIQLEPPNSPELEPIVERFNQLASALLVAREENSSLNQELITVREEERKLIASDLHDEAGPCLFGITTTVAAIEAALPPLPGDQHSKICGYLSEIGVIVQQLKAVNRQILNRLRPLILEQATIGERITELVSELRHRHPEVQFKLDLGELAKSYGNLADLTVYRCVQEGVTNALKHGHPASVSIEFAEKSLQKDGAFSRFLSLTVRDTGKGIPAVFTMGFGLTGMRERVRSLGGSLALSANQPVGTTIHTSIPLPVALSTVLADEELSS